MDIEQKQKKEPKKLNVNRVLIDHFKLFAAITAILSVSLGYYGVIKPTREEFSRKAGGDIKQIQQEKFSRQNDLKQLTERLKNFEVVNSQNISVLRKLLMPVGEKENMLFTLNVLAQQFGVYIKSFKLEEQISLNEYFGSGKDLPLPIVVVPASLAIAGKNLSYNSIKKILAGFQTKYGIFNIRSLDLADLGKQPQGAEAGESELELKVDMFFIGDESDAPAQAEPTTIE